MRTLIWCFAWSLSVLVAPAAIAQDRGLAIEYSVKVGVYRPNIHPVALLAIAAVTAVVGVAAAFVPARPAVRLDPLMTLRHE